MNMNSLVYFLDHRTDVLTYRVGVKSFRKMYYKFCLEKGLHLVPWNYDIYENILQSKNLEIVNDYITVI